jgi:hypothetical protein
MFATMGFGVYFFFASLMLCAAVFVFFLVPETKGIPLEAMDKLFSGDYPARRAHKAVLNLVRQEDQEFRRGSMMGEKTDLDGTLKQTHVEKV